MENRSKTFQLSKYDIVSWLKQFWLNLVPIAAMILVEMLPELLVITQGWVTTTFSDNEIILGVAVSLSASFIQLIRKWLTDYTKTA